MIIKHENTVTNLYKGDKVCFCAFKGENLIYSLFTPETIRILKENFPTKIDEIVEYANRHLQIVPFINDDTMLVCSLGIEGMPIRFIHGGYTNQVSTGIVPTTTMAINAKFRMNSVTLYHPVFQQGYISEDTMTTRCIAVNGNSNKLNFTLCEKTGGGGKSVTFDYNVSGRWMDMQMNDTQVIVNGTTYVFTGTNRGSKNDNPIWLLGRGDIYGATDIDIQLFQTIDGDSKHTFVPFKDGQTCYIIDIESGNKIQGSFTIEYTLPDGTPWQPIT